MKDLRNVTPETAEVNTGVKAPGAVSEKLGELLTGTYELLIRTHEVHWNIEGPMFYSVHMLTEGQYNELFAATDVLAERMRALGHLAPASPKALVDTSGENDKKATSSAVQMITMLKERHEALARLCHEITEMCESDDVNDPVTADLCNGRSAVHEKAAWMLRAMAS
ncbi:Dps family protein [Pararhodobacter sp. CCB-MM2]|uniref:Dps family protein n=1 Tax=Pararhodobacter sp. CCB-MM2 TaxID=1786003 RepID=UPI00082E06D8|nr:DNA starvation/stationary phase protection protein [Pararhodobacter sp. CCB-MM2]MCA2012935.1 DNA starvation/stationary phase protection protein [Cereibacter sphaeroides]